MPSNVTVAERTLADVRRVVIHSKITTIAAGAFRSWTNLEEVVFAGCSGLRMVEMQTAQQTSTCRRRAYRDRS